MSSTITRRTLICASALLVATVAAAQAPQSNAAGTDQQVRAAQQQMLQAAIQGDKDGVEKFLADNATWVSANGQMMDKGQVVGMLPAPVHSVDVDRVQPVGNAAAILTGTAHMKDGTETRFLQEWVNRDGAWKLLAHEGTRIAAQGTPPAATTGMARPSGTPTTGTAGIAEPNTVAPTLNSDVERAVWRAQTDLVEAYNKGDVNKYSKLTGDNFTRIGMNGEVYNRQQWMDLVRKNAKQPLKNGALSDVQITPDETNTTARVTLRMVAYGPDGTPQQPERQTRIFALHNGVWQQVAAVATPVGPQQ